MIHEGLGAYLKKIMCMYMSYCVFFLRQAL